jgi:hypothetical protein
MLFYLFKLVMYAVFDCGIDFVLQVSDLINCSVYIFTPAIYAASLLLCDLMFTFLVLHVHRWVGLSFVPATKGLPSWRKVRPELLQGTFKCLECGGVVKNVEQQWGGQTNTILVLLVILNNMIFCYISFIVYFYMTVLFVPVQPTICPDDICNN